MIRMFALLSSQGTACYETALCESHYDKLHKEQVETTPISNQKDPPILGTWEDVSGNDVLSCIVCGAVS